MNDSVFKVNAFQAVKHIPVASVIETFAPGINLKQHGDTLSALCPFHSEKTPSFKVSIRRNIWTCFGECGESGDGVSFVAKLNGWQPIEAARAIAQEFNIEIDGSTMPPEKKREVAARQQAVERERALQAAFAEWEYDTFIRLVRLRDSIKDVLNEQGLDAPDVYLDAVRDLWPQLNYYIEILATGSLAEKVALWRWKVFE